MPIDVKQLADTIKGWVAERLKEFEASLPDRLRKHIDELPKPQNGKDADPQVMAAEIARQVALLPKPVDGKSVDADEVRAMVAAAAASEVAKLPRPADGKNADPADIERAAKAAVAALPAPDVATLVRSEVQRQVAELPKPKNGEDGKSVDVTAMKAAMTMEIRAAVDALPKPRDGASVDPEVVRAMVTNEVAEAIAKLPKPANGKDVDHELVEAAIVREVREAVAAIPVPQNGKDADQPAIVAQVFDLVMRAMPKPQDGKSVTVEDVKPLLEAEVQHWELEFERRVSDRLDRLAERYKGKDGEDGFSPEDLDIELMDDGRTVAVSLKAASGRVVRRELTLVGMTQDRDVFRAGAAYKKGDCVTYGGSYWCAKSDTSEPPRGPSNAWRMVMKGRDK